jgi:large subunit ribosomal protein L15
MPIHRRLPKRGFTNPTRKEVAVINIRDLNRFDRESIVDDVALMQSGLIKGPLDGIKLLGQGEIKHPLTVKVNAVSKAAREKIEGAGGTVEVC